MTRLQQLLENFQEINYRQQSVSRDPAAYQQTENHITHEVQRLLDMYRSRTSLDQTARLIRDGIDLYLRRYHAYSIGGDIQSHYRQRGVPATQCDFEHVIPQSKMRDALIQGCITIKQALNPPTCLLHRDLHAELKKQGLGSSTPSLWKFWDRYHRVFDREFETHDGVLIDTKAWTLADHYRYFGVESD